MQSRLMVRGISEPRSGCVKGQALAQSLEETKVFPEMSVEMIEVGESTGALPAMLNSVSEFYEEDVQNALGNGHGADRAGNPDCHGRGRGVRADLAVPADLQLWEPERN